MHNGSRSRKLVSYGAMLVLSWSLMPMGLPVSYSQQPVPIEPAPEQLTPTEAERAREAERLRQAEQLRRTEPTRAADLETRVEHKQVRPSDTYVGGFGGYTFGGDLNVEGTGLLPGLTSNERGLADSVVYGGKVGHFFGDRMDWLGVEMEAYNTTPHVEQEGALPGIHQRVTTLAFNVIGRLKFLCETKTQRTETRTERAAESVVVTERKHPTTGELTREWRDPSTGDLYVDYTESRDPRTGELLVERVDPRTGQMTPVKRGDVKVPRARDVITERKHPTTGELTREWRDPNTGDLYVEYKESRDPRTGELLVERVDARTGQMTPVKREDVKAPRARDIRHETRYEREFCRLQPYGGVGLGVFFANLSTNGNSASDNAVPGFNGLAGLRYFFTERIALFGEYKYNFASFDYDGFFGGGAGVKADYQINHFVGGLSLHF